MKKSHIPYEGAMSHMKKESYPIWRRHVTYEGVMSRMEEACHTWRRHVTHRKESYHTARSHVAYGVATIRRLLKIIGVFCKRALQKRIHSAKETYNFKEPTNRSHPGVYECVIPVHFMDTPPAPHVSHLWVMCYRKESCHEWMRRATKKGVMSNMNTKESCHVSKKHVILRKCYENTIYTCIYIYICDIYICIHMYIYI